MTLACIPADFGAAGLRSYDRTWALWSGAHALTTMSLVYAWDPLRTKDACSCHQFTQHVHEPRTVASRLVLTLRPVTFAFVPSWVLHISGVERLSACSSTNHPP